MIYEISHRTTFTYAQPVSISHHVLHLTPRPVPRQRWMNAAIFIEPAPSLRAEGSDYFGNPVTYLTVQEPHRTLLVQSSARVEVTPPAVPDTEAGRPWEEVVGLLAQAREDELLEACQFAFMSPYVSNGEAVYDYARTLFTPGRPLLSATRALTARIFEEFDYQGGVTDVSTPVDEVLQRRRGVCQDFAHLQLACLRSLGLAARYISGYLLTHPPEGKDKLVGADASHAWISVWCPDQGWVDFDPTNDLLPGEEHIVLAWGRDYGDVSPINGFMVGGGEHQVTVAVDVAPQTA